MNKQEFNVVNTRTNTECLFFKHSGKTAKQHADEYVERNKKLFPMQLFRHTTKPKPFPRWELIAEYIPDDAS